MSERNRPLSIVGGGPWARLAIVMVALLVAAAIVAGIGASEEIKILPLQAWWLAMLLVGIAMVAGTVTTRWQRTGLIIAALLIGTSAQLGLTQPIWFQYIRIRPTDNFSYFLLFSISIQGLVTAAFLLQRGRISSACAAIRSLGPLKTALLLVTMSVFSFTAMRHIGSQNYLALMKQLTISSGFLMLNLGTVLALALSLPKEALSSLTEQIGRAVSLPGTPDKSRSLDRSFPRIIALWTLAATVTLCLVAFQGIPRVADEVVYLFQAKSLLLGQISVPSPAPIEAFEHNLIHALGDQWFSITPPGWALFLAVGVLAGLPWLVNPVLAAATILLSHAVLCKVATRGTANVAILLIATSPWFIATSASLMNHTVTLALALAAVLALLNARSAGSVPLAILSGIFMGLLFLTRPLEGVLIGTLVGLWSLSFVSDRSGWRLVIGYGLGCVMVGVLIFPFHFQLTGDPFLTPLNHYIGEVWHVGANSLGFGAKIGPPSQWGGTDLYAGHSPLEVSIHAQHNTYTMNFELFGWAVGSLCMFFAHAIWGRWTRLDVTMLLTITIMLGAYSLYWFSGSFYIGPRYWFMMFFPLIVISTSGIRTVAMKLRSLPGQSFAVERLGIMLVVLSVLAMVSFMTWRGVGKYYEFRGFHTDYQEMIDTGKLEGALVFVSTDSASDFSSAFAHNMPDLSGPGPVFSRDLGPSSNRAVAAGFPGRPIYFVEGRSDTNSKARIIRGPVSQESLP